MELDRVLDRLSGNAAIVTALCQHVSDEQARWRPVSEHWSMVEVLNHLADEEVEDFRVYIDYTLHRPGEPWPAIDPQGWVTERRYQERSLGESLDRFLRNRTESIDWLAGLADADWSRSHERPGRARLTAGDLLASWVGHDFIHIRQLTRLHRAFFVEYAVPNSVEYAGPW